MTGANATWTNGKALYVGNFGNGTLRIESGGAVSGERGYIGMSVGSAGAVTVTGAGSAWMNADNLYVGHLGNGTLRIENSGKVNNATGIVGYAHVANGSVVVTGNGSTWTNGDLYVGSHGNGTLTIENSGTVGSAASYIGATSYVGAVSTGTGLVTVTGSGSAWNAQNLTVGLEAHGTLVIEKGGKVESSGGIIGDRVSGTGAVTVTGSGSTWTNAGELLVGNAGKGTLTIENGGTVSSTWGFLGVDASSSAVVTVANGGTWKLVTGGSPSKLVFGAGSSTGTLNIGAYDLSSPTTAGTVAADRLETGTGSGTLNFNQTDAITFSSLITGNIAVNQRGSGTTTLTNDNTYTGGTTIGGGTLQIGNGGTAGSIKGDVVNNGALVFNRSDALTFAGAISGNGAVHQVGDGTTILTGTNTYSGGTTISGGTLQIGNGGPWGLLAGNVVNNGTLAFNRDGLWVLDGAISGTGAVRQIGGTTVLTGSNAYTGNTTVEAGTLQFGDGTSAGSTNTLGGRIDVIGGGLAIRTPATVSVAQDVTFADNTALAITTTASGSSLHANRLSLGTGVAFNLSGIDDANQLDKVLIDTASGITGDFGTVTIGGAAGTVDYLSLATRKSGDGKQYLATYNLTWNAGNQAAGTFTLAGAGDRFTLGAALGNQDASGAWDGKSLTKAGDGTLVLTGANTYTGGTAITGGTLQIGNGGTAGSIVGNVANGGTLAFNRSDMLTFDGEISGNGAIRQTGSGRTNLTGDSSGFTGSTMVEKGTLSVNGQLGGTLNVLAAGRLQGNGTVGDTVVTGTVAPGNSIGTLNVASVDFNPGSIYEVEVNAAGQSDKIVAAGTATINGGTVRVLAGAGDYAPSTTYTILTAAGGRTGTFDGVTSNFAFLTPTLSYDTNDVTLTLTRNATAFAAIGATRNQAAAGSGVESLGADNALAAAVVGFSADQARAAFDLLSGEVHTSAKSALIENGRHVQNAMTDRLRGAFDILGAQTAEPIKVAALGDVPVLPAAVHAGPVLWTQGYGSWGRIDGDGNAARLKHDSQGIFIGTDSPVGDWRFGAVAGIGRTGFDTSDRRSNGHSDNYHLGLYGGAQWDALSFRTGAAWTRHDLSTSRTVAIPGFTDNLKADYRARTVQVFGELGYRMRGRQAVLEPFANLAHTNLRTDGFTERGGATALRTGATTTDATFSTLGLRAATQVALGTSRARLAGTLGWRHAFGGATPESTLRFASGGNDFGIAGTPIARNSAVFEAGLDFRLTSNATLGASYVGQLASGAREHGVKVGFNMEF
ncbi:MAG: autotransporter domain-containing protein [Oryzomicrobium sp.]|nr:autotransporter domain-containing protein [Oryzomicrobium sp.]